MNELTSAIDNHLTASQKVPGRGKRYATDMWLDARDMTSYRAISFDKKKKNKAMTVALNEFDKYFYSSANYDYLQPGKHTTLRVKQVQHVATTRFMNVDLVSRQCRFSHENPGLRVMFKLYQNTLKF